MKFWDDYCVHKQIAPEMLEYRTALLRKNNQTIVTLNGSFDLIHTGHLHLLYEASSLADVLIVALNSDLSIQRYKSENRPILPLKERIALISSIAFVDFVTWFEELDPCTILEKIKPDIHVNGLEYGDNCIEAEVVKKHGRLHLVDRIEGFSTTSIIERICQRNS